MSEIDRLRASYYYYSKKQDVLSRCKAAHLRSQIQAMQQAQRAARYEQKLRLFLQEHPQYVDVLKKEEGNV
jgi:hypothetical protein